MVSVCVCASPVFSFHTHLFEHTCKNDTHQFHTHKMYKHYRILCCMWLFRWFLIVVRLWHTHTVCNGTFFLSNDVCVCECCFSPPLYTLTHSLTHSTLYATLLTCYIHITHYTTIAAITIQHTQREKDMYICNAYTTSPVDFWDEKHFLFENLCSTCNTYVCVYVPKCVFQ